MNLIAVQSVPYAQHTKLSAHRRYRLQQINLTAVQRFQYILSIRIRLLTDNAVCRTNKITATNRNVAQHQDLSVGDRYGCSASIFD